MVRYKPFYSAKPLLVAGHGVRLANAQKELMQVLDKYKIPVVTTFNGFDLIPSKHPCFVGRIGTLGTPRGIYALQNCDLLIELGTRNNIRQVSYKEKTFAPKATKLVIDIDRNELDKYKCLKYHGDVKEFLTDIDHWEIFDINKDWLISLKRFRESTSTATPYNFIQDFTERLPEGATVICGNGTACVVMFQAGIVKKDQRIFWNSGCAGMGYDIPAAIGACFGNGRKEVYCITGDGSIQMNIQELQTIKHYKLPVKIIILNNGGYHSIKMTQDNYFKSDYIGCNEKSGVSFPDFRKIAFAYGISYLANWKDVFKIKGSCICVVDIGNDYVFSPKWTRGFE